ncbi:hypothetical protein FQA39_LY12893 [Lamprigera yunnana]|nr:hypothetical protein FQA39_LY12893 [Lamprigera yunnana]
MVLFQLLKYWNLKLIVFDNARGETMELIFNNINEEKLYEKYKLLKGEEYHFYVAEQIGSNQYSDVAAAIQYDLKLKYILYRYVSFFEEGLRAIIMNCDIKDVDFFLDNRISLSDIQHLYFKNMDIILDTYPNLNIISQAEFNGLEI